MTGYVVINIPPANVEPNNIFNLYMQNGMPDVDPTAKSTATFKSPRQIQQERIASKQKS